MLHPIWFVTLATILSAPLITIIFKKKMKDLRVVLEKQEKFDNSEIGPILTKMFIKIPIAEVFPIILVIFTFIQIDKAENSPHLYPIENFMGLAIILSVWFLCSYFIISETKKPLVLKHEDRFAKTLFINYRFIGLSLVSAIPIIGVVVFFIINRM